MKNLSLGRRLAAGAVICVSAFIVEAPTVSAAELSATVSDADIAAAAGAKSYPVHAMPATGAAARPYQDKLSGNAPHANITNINTNTTTNPTPYFASDLTFQGGPVIPTASMHLVYVNCGTGKCWGTVGTTPTPKQFLTDFNVSTESHVTDQYVNTTANGRYPVSAGVFVKQTLVNNTATYANILSILASAVSTLGTTSTGYKHMYHLFFPSGTNVCDPQGNCNLSGGNFCAYHSSADMTVKNVNVHVIFSVEPYQDIPGCAVTGGPNELNDSTASVLDHETTEAITDPDLNAWWNAEGLDEYGYEIGDECQLANFAAYPTLSLDTHSYKVQLEYSNTYHGCAGGP